MVALVFGNLDAFVDVDGVRVACKEERKLSTRRNESKEVEVVLVSGHGGCRTIGPRSHTESALYLHTPNLRQGLRIHKTFFLLSIGLRTFTLRHLAGQNMLIPAHDLPSLHLPT